MNDHRRYQPYYRGKSYRDRRYDDDENNDYKRHYKKSNSNSHRYSYSSSTFRRDERSNYNHYRETNNRYSNKNDHRYPYSQTKSRNHTTFSTPPPPFDSVSVSASASTVSTTSTTPAPTTTKTATAPVQPTTKKLTAPAPSTTKTSTEQVSTTTKTSTVTNKTTISAPNQLVVPHERESWVRSVKKTSVNESIEQKSQYLETILRMPQQKSTVNASKFDRMRFAKEPSEREKSSNSSENAVSSAADCHDLTNSTFHLISDTTDDDDIRTIERILFDNQMSSNLTETTTQTETNESNIQIAQYNSGFLIDDCEDEEIVPPSSPPPAAAPFLTEMTDRTTGEATTSEEDINERRALLLNELNAADAERRQELKRQKRLQQTLQSRKFVTQVSKNKKTTTKQVETSINEQEAESPADWLVEYRFQPSETVNQLKNEVEKSSFIVSEEEKMNKVNLILMKIKKQQEELRKLRQYVLSIVGDQTEKPSKKSTRSNASISEDLLITILNQSTSTGCWLCSGKMYSEVGIQCDFMAKP